jgi:MerR family transcriptional regulator, light-induced transcriptional regulator
MSGERETEQAVHIHPGEAEVIRILPGFPRRFASHRPFRHHSGDMRDALSDAIRNIVLPRLVAARRAKDQSLAACGRVVTQEDVNALLSHVATADHNLAEAMLDTLRLRGVSRQDILLDLFQPAAQRLGDQWLDDQCTFADVTLATGRLQRLMRSDAMPKMNHSPCRPGGRILIATMPGDQHSFGASVVEDIFRDAGWETLHWTGKDPALLAAAAASSRYDVIGLSVSEPHLLDGLQVLAGTLRRASVNAAAKVIAGGQAFTGGGAFSSAPTLASSYGLDAVIADARTAVGRVTALLEAPCGMA